MLATNKGVWNASLTGKLDESLLDFGTVVEGVKLHGGEFDTELLEGGFGLVAVWTVGLGEDGDLVGGDEFLDFELWSRHFESGCLGVTTVDSRGGFGGWMNVAGAVDGLWFERFACDSDSRRTGECSEMG